MKLNNKGDSSYLIILFLPLFIIILFCFIIPNSNNNIGYQGTLTSIQKVDSNKSIGQFYNMSFDNGDFHIMVIDNHKLISNKTQMGLTYSISYHSNGGVYYIDTLTEIKPLPPPPSFEQLFFVFTISIIIPITIILLAIIYVRLYCLNHKKPKWIKEAEYSMLAVVLLPYLAFSVDSYTKKRLR